MKKIFLIVLVVCLSFLAIIPISAYTPPVGQGTESDPWIATTSDDLQRYFNLGGYIKLQNSVSSPIVLNSHLTIMGSNSVTLDLNGKMITGSGPIDSMIAIMDSANITIIDSSPDRSGKLGYCDSEVIFLSNTLGTISIYGGNYKCFWDIIYGSTSQIKIYGGNFYFNEAIILSDYLTTSIKIYGGNFYGASGRPCYIMAFSGLCTIYGGTFNGGLENFMYAPLNSLLAPGSNYYENNILKVFTTELSYYNTLTVHPTLTPNAQKSEFYANGTSLTIESKAPSYAVEITRSHPSFSSSYFASSTYAVWNENGVYYCFALPSYSTVYGGSYNATINANVNITMNDGLVYNIFGAGKGNNGIIGNVNITINGGTVSGYIMGGGDLGGLPSGRADIIINGGIVANLTTSNNYGGLPQSSLITFNNYGTSSTYASLNIINNGSPVKFNNSYVKLNYAYLGTTDLGIGSGLECSNDIRISGNLNGGGKIWIGQGKFITINGSATGSTYIEPLETTEQTLPRTLITSPNAAVNNFILSSTVYDGKVLYKNGNNINITTLLAPPVISTQPSGNDSAKVGDLVELTAAASSTDSGNISYQWFYNTTNNTENGTEISGAISSTYTVPATAVKNKTYYYCKITNSLPDCAPSSVFTNIASVTIGKGTPSYSVPTGLNATYGQKLSDVTLPSGWTWKDSTLSVGNAGINTFKATFTPADTVNYNVVNDIDVTVNVGKADPPYTIPTGVTAIYGMNLLNVPLPTGFTWVDGTLSVGNAGINTFKAILTPVDTVNYNIINDIDINVNVLKGIPFFTPPTGLNAVYGQKLSDIVLPAGWTWDDSSLLVGNFGSNSFKATFTPTDTDNYCIISNVNVNITVFKANPSYTVPTGLVSTYGQKLSDITLPAGWTWANGTLSVGNAGNNTFKATFTPTDTANYNVISNIDVTIKVEKADPSYTVPSLTATYGQKLSDITLPTGWDWPVSAVPVGNVGNNTFNITFIPEDTANYNIVTNILVIVKVEKANPSYIVPTGLTSTYGMKLSDVVLPAGWSWVDSTLSVGNAGNNIFKATFTPADTANYNVITNIDITVKVEKANPSYTVPTGLTATYGNKLSDVVLPTGWTWADNTLSVGNAGNNTFKATFTPVDTANYNVISNINVVVKVEKANPSYTIPTGLTATYGNKLSDVVLPTGWTWINNTLSVGNAGNNTFKATFTPADTANYNVITNIDIDFKVEKANPSYTIPTGLTTTYGKKLSDVVLPTGWTWADNTLSVGNAGNNTFKATFTPADTANYNVITNIDIAVKVEKANPYYTIPTGLTTTYGKKLSDIALPAGWTWADNTLSVGNAGNNTFKATFTPADTANYNVISDIDVTIKVEKANPVYTVLTGLTSTYGMKLSDVALPAGWTWADNTLSVGNAGNNTFEATFTPADTANYNVIINIDVIVKVEKANPVYTVPTGLTSTYGIKLSDVALPAGWTWTDNTLSVGNAGNNTFEATFTPADTANYNVITNIVITIKVEKANPSYTVPTGLTATYGKKLSDVVLPTGWAWVDNTLAVGNAGNNTFKATFTPANTANYNVITNIDIDVKVEKANPSYIIPTGLTTTYGKKLSDIALPTGWTWADSTLSVGNAGNNTFKAIFTPADTSNYNVISNIDVTIKVEKANPSYTVPTGLTATFGQKLSNITLPTGWTWADNTLSVGNAGNNTFKAIFTPADTANYNVITNIDIAVKVEKANPSYTVPTGLTAIYGQKLSDVVLPAGWSWAESTLSVGNAGNNTFKAIFTPADTANYNVITNIDITVKVEKANPSYTVPTGLTATFGQKLSDITLPTGWMWDDNTLLVGNAGNNTFKATFTPADTANYNVIANIAITLTVGKSNPSYTVPTGLTATFGQKLSDITLPTGWTWADNTLSVGNTGNNTFKATFTPADTANYDVIANIDITLTVGKSNPSYTVLTGLTATFGQKLSDITLPTGWTWADNNLSVGNAGNNTFKATFTPADTANYNVITNIDITLTVGKANPSYTVPTGLTATYGQKLSDVTLPTSWAWIDSTLSVGNIGVNTFKAAFTPVDSDNYTVVVDIDVSVTVGKANVTDTPASPIVSEKSTTGITFIQVAGCEYSIDNGATWQDSNVFVNLTPDTEYTCIARIKATETHNASAISAVLTVKTSKLPAVNTETSWEHGNNSSLVFNIDLDGAGFIGITVNGKAINASDYTISDDGKVITLDSDFLSTLEIGNHTIVISTSSGDAQTTFKVVEENDEPVTSDSNPVYALSGLMLASLICALTLLKKRSRVK